MRSVAIRLAAFGVAVMLPLACIDPDDSVLFGTTDILVVEGTITNLAQPQLILLKRAHADRLTGQYGTTPLTKASVEVVLDSSEVVSAHETTDGNYQLPNDFKGQIGHAYQLRFTLTDGTHYVSTQQVMPSVSPISKINARFNPTSLSTQQLKGYRAAHDIFIDSQDPASQHNYYRWEWTLWERQYWCHTCNQGVYSQYKVLPGVYKDRDYFITGNEPFEDCFSPLSGKAAEEAPDVPTAGWVYDYQCRTACWQIIYSYDILVFDDKFANGSLIDQQRVAQIPFYDTQPALVDVRQLSLTADAYRYYKLFQEQTQHTGGLADTPPTALAGNVHQVDHPQVSVVGFFSASAVSLVHYWLDRKDVQGASYGATGPTGAHVNDGDDLFYAFKGRRPSPEPPPPYIGAREKAMVRLWPNTDRPPLAPCLQSDSQTPFKPTGWKE